MATPDEDGDDPAGQEHRPPPDQVEQQRTGRHHREGGGLAHQVEDDEDLAPALRRVVVGHQGEAGDVGRLAGHAAEEPRGAVAHEVAGPGGDDGEDPGDDRAEGQQRDALVTVGPPAEPDHGEGEEEADHRLQVDDRLDADPEVLEDERPGVGRRRRGDSGGEAGEDEDRQRPGAVGRVAQIRPVAGDGPQRPLHDTLPFPLCSSSAARLPAAPMAAASLASLGSTARPKMRTPRPW